MIQINIKDIFPKDGVYESILGSTGVLNNLSPIGIIREGDNISAKIYRNTLTYSNISKIPKCSIHITDNPRIFYNSLFGNINYTIKNALPIINDESIYEIIFAKCIKLNNDNPSIFLLDPYSIEIGSNVHRGFSRGYSLLIDALVHFTRLDILPNKEVLKLLNIINYELKTSKRLSPDMEDIIRDLENKIVSKGYKLE
ncbi:DUF447 domain-containing protein [Acidianus brierleyi]|uniref:DUF447 domain-containing protein n=1 Tax=Acidianus brierleyi TaxID=41673 RepID=A0A2U9IEL4_9CREN|nr:DUF447 domain-containing protein [Acidianus brierleyi]AWR94406.1 DUF447 family protein [Acidianus brierleyi]